MTFDVNALIGKLIDTMPVWLPLVLAAWHSKQPAYMNKGDK
jgi:hypothetical protein